MQQANQLHVCNLYTNVVWLASPAAIVFNYYTALIITQLAKTSSKSGSRSFSLKPGAGVGVLKTGVHM